MPPAFRNIDVMSLVDGSEGPAIRCPQHYNNFTVARYRRNNPIPQITNKMSEMQLHDRSVRRCEAEECDDYKKFLEKVQKVIELHKEQFRFPPMPTLPVVEMMIDRERENMKKRQEEFEKKIAKKRESWSQEQWKAHYINESIVQSMHKSHRIYPHYVMVVLGDHKTGKTEFIQKFMKHDLKDEHEPGLSCSLVTFEDGDKKSAIQLWEVSAEENLETLKTPIGYLFCAVLILCDVSRPETMDAAVKWKTLIQGTYLLKYKTAPFMLVRNKSDLIKEGAVSNAKEMEEFVAHHGFYSWTETTSKSVSTIEDTIMHLVSKEKLRQEEIMARVRQREAQNSALLENNLLKAKEMNVYE